MAAGQARINFDNSAVDVFVVASDFPHGVVEFGQPFQILADEGVGVAEVPVLRNFGSIGTLMANFTVIPDTATPGVDFMIQELSEYGVVCSLFSPVMCLQHSVWYNTEIMSRIWQLLIFGDFRFLGIDKFCL